jgi:predicted DNA-binding antitoxin AbrB/MazE fold protein
MIITIEATYENGILKLDRRLPLKEQERVCVTVHTEGSPLLQAYGIMAWTADAGTLERVALDPEFLAEEAP